MLVTRYKNKDGHKNLYFARGSKIEAVSLANIRSAHRVDSIIKLFKKDFHWIKPGARRLTHFNIQHCGHKPGRKYLIVKIEKPGYFDGKTERPPVLGRRPFLIAQCLSVRNRVGYEAIVPKNFKYSLTPIGDVAALKKAMVRRYKHSLAHLSDREKLSLGVSITELKIIKNMSQEPINIG